MQNGLSSKRVLSFSELTTKQIELKEQLRVARQKEDKDLIKKIQYDLQTIEIAFDRIVGPPSVFIN